MVRPIGTRTTAGMVLRIASHFWMLHVRREDQGSGLPMARAITMSVPPRVLVQLVPMKALLGAACTPLTIDGQQALCSHIGIRLVRACRCNDVISSRSAYGPAAVCRARMRRSQPRESSSRLGPHALGSVSKARFPRPDRFGWETS